MAFNALHHLLPGAARRAGITRDLAVTTALRAAQGVLAAIFGEPYARFADVVSVRRDGALVIACRSPAVAQTIRLHDADILRAVTKAAPSLGITRTFLIPRSREDVRTVPTDEV